MAHSRDKQRTITTTLALLLAALGVAATIAVPLATKEIRRLSVTQEFNERLLNQTGDHLPRMQILVEDQAVDNPHQVYLRIENSGNVPIRADDIEAPLTIRFHSSRVVLSQIISTTPDDLDATVSADQDTIAISHGLLNSRDSVLISVILDGQPFKTEATARIWGIKNVSYSTSSDGNSSATAIAFEAPVSIEILSLLPASLLTIFFVGFAIGIPATWIATSNFWPLSPAKLAKRLGDISPTRACEHMLGDRLSSTSPVDMRREVAGYRSLHEATVAGLFQPLRHKIDAAELSSRLDNKDDYEQILIKYGVAQLPNHTDAVRAAKRFLEDEAIEFLRLRKASEAQIAKTSEIDVDFSAERPLSSYYESLHSAIDNMRELTGWRLRALLPDAGAVIGFLVLLAFATSLALVVANSWIAAVP